MEMYPTVPVTYSVRRHQENSPNVARFLEPDEYAIINVNLKDPQVSIFTKFGADENFNNSKTFELVRADKLTYEVSVMLLKTVGENDNLIGGWIGSWTVDAADIEDAKEVRFHVMQKYPIPETTETLLETYNLITNITAYPDVKPEIIRIDTGAEEAGFFS
ncbi:hypothetical protein HY772_05770 [Candidatus Woesearchaeota archaeon]|nr:hypothetical protein [Candidatus Woesearchaeota archaeon]